MIDDLSRFSSIGRPVDRRADIWSFGVVLYEIITGRRPFAGHYPDAVVYSILHESPPPPSTFLPDLPGHLERVLEKALVKAGFNISKAGRFLNLSPQSMRYKIKKLGIHLPVE